VGINVVYLLENLTVMGLDQVLVRFVPAYRAQGQARLESGLLKVAWIVPTVCSIGIGALLYSLSDPIALNAFHNEGMVPVLRLMAISLVFFTWVAIGASSAQATGSPLRSFLIQDVVFPVAGLTILVGLTLVRAGMLAPQYAFLGSCVIGGCLALGVAVPRKHWLPPSEFEPGRWVSFGGQMLAIETGAFVFTNMSPTVLAIFDGVSQAGLYNVALALALQGSVLFAGMQQVLPAILAALFADQRFSEAETLLKSAVRWLALLGQPFYIALIFMGPYLLGAFGSAFRQGEPLLVAVAIGQLVATVTVFNGYALVMSGHQRIDVANHVGIVVLALVVYPVTASHFGAMGVAIATGSLSALMATAKTIEVWLLLGVRTWDKRLLRVLTLGVVAGFVCWVAHQGSIDSSFLGAGAALLFAMLLYGSMALLTLDAEDRRIPRLVLSWLTKRA
jgi:O-antigen/teichoic acid export membrane protein